MTFWANKHGEWIQIQPPQLNVEGVWYPCKAVYANVHGDWMLVWRHEAQIITLPVRRFVNEYRELQDVRSCAA